MRMAPLLLGAFLVASGPNLIWNIANGLTTVQHTLDNANWIRDPAVRAGLNWSSLAEFFGAQFAVFGPILFGSLLLAAGLWRRLDERQQFLLLFALPIIVLVCGQALLSQAYANWAATAYLAGSVAVLPWLTRSWLIASFVVNGSLCLLFPLAATAPDVLTRDGQPLLNRYIRRHEMSDAILTAAEAHGLGTIVAGDRDILADLFYSGRDQQVRIYAIPPRGRPQHHYAQNFAYPGQIAPFLLVLRSSKALPCSADKLRILAPETGAYRQHPMALYRAPADCFQSASSP